MADDTIRNDNVVRNDIDAENNTEPATKHDVTEGGVIGAVGGAVVGGLAGGPLGAVIGAVAGGAASAGAVDVVDKHDHDYNRTIARDNGDVVDTTGTPVGAGLGNRAYSDYDTDFRNDYQTRYAATGAAYDEYDPAYRYGYGLNSDARYQDQDWDTIEPGARSDWESRQPGTWNRFKDSVRYAWDRAKSHV